ncbi:hypothetical protein HK103_000133 [Boothiomyces macroporosus]|uniref:Profilin n=1 Tax=Boothiomyces macroporosus TaxID=261099 RepID=A0AAD5UNC0_9FUNG|nr:hypothetical protein HK103_000133 [Boothiomyces macroporosus]
MFCMEMEVLFLFNQENDPIPELVTQLSTEIINTDLLVILVQNIQLLEFEAKKDVAQIFNNLLRRQLGTRFPTADYIGGKPEVLMSLIGGYEKQDISLNCGMILRESLRHELLAKIIIESPQFWNFFQYVELSTFDVASDAFATFKDCLTKHKSLVVGFLEAHYDQLLGELLLDRNNYSIMLKYIASPDNLRLMMNLLREKSKNIQFEAFHVFKVSSTEIQGILAAFKDATAIRANGLLVGGIKHIAIRADERSVYGKKGTGGVCCVKTKQAILIAMYEEPVQFGEATKVVEALADYLISVNY